MVAFALMHVGVEVIVQFVTFGVQRTVHLGTFFDAVNFRPEDLHGSEELIGEMPRPGLVAQQ